MSTRKNAELAAQPNPARRALLTGGAVGLAAVAGATLGGAEPASAQSDSQDVTWIVPASPPDAATDTANIQNALNANGFAWLSPGTFSIKEAQSGKAAITIPAPTSESPVGGALRGTNNTVLAYVGNTQCVSAHSSQTGNVPDLSVYPATAQGIEISSLTIDGENAGPNAVGIDAGDYDDSIIWRVRTANFSQPNQIGLHLNNQVMYTEKWRVFTQHFNCQNPVVIEQKGGLTSSFGYSDFDFHINALDATVLEGVPVTQNGVIMQNHCNFYNSSLRIRGNWANPGVASPLAQNPSAVLIVGQGSTNATIKTCQLVIHAEVNGSGTGENIPASIVFGSTANVITNCFGQLQFNAFSAAYNQSGEALQQSEQLIFGGPVNDPTLMNVNQTAPTGWL